MSNQKKWAVLLLLLVIVTGMIYYAVRGRSLDRTSSDIEIIPIDRNFDIVALSADSAGMNLNSELKLLCRDPVKLSDVKKLLSIMPSKPYDVKKVSDKEFIISFNETLSPNSLYKVSLKNEGDRELSWAFQTKKEFKVVRSLPRDKGTYVPINSGIEIQFSYSDIEPIDNYFEITPKVEGRFEYHKGTAVFIHKGLEENTVYTVKLKPGIKLKNSTEKTSEEYIFKFKTEKKTDRFNSFFRFSDEMYNVTSKNISYLEVYASETFKGKDLNIEVYKYKQKQDFIDNIIKIDDCKFSWHEKSDIKVALDLNKLDKILGFNTTLMRADKNYWNSTFIGLPEPLSEGDYLINVIHNDENYQTHIQVNDLAVYAMVGEKENLIWVNDSITGKPVESAKVFVAGDKKHSVTNKQGIAIIEDSVSIEEPFNRAYFKIDKTERPSFFVRVIPDFYDYQHYYFDDYYGDIDNTSYWTYLYMDRGLYLPDDKINIWGLVKSRDHLDVPKKGVLYLNSSDYGDKNLEVEKKEVIFNEFGCYDGSFEFTNLMPGRYSIELKVNDEVISKKYFEIAKYTKPAYKVKAEFDKKNIFAWDTSKLKINANFFEESPVSGLKLDYHYYEDSGRESKRKSGTLNCDTNGFVEFEYKPDIATVDWRPKNIYMNIQNAEAEDEEVWIDESIKVFPKDIMINTKMQISEDKTAAQVSIETNKIDINKKIEKEDNWNYEDIFKGQPIDRNLKVKIYERYYEKHEVGEYYDFVNKKIYKKYDYTEKSKLIKKIDAKTVSGIYLFEIPLEEEKNYYIEVFGEDTRGNAITESRYISIYDIYDPYFENKYNIVETDSNKDSYRTGEDVKLKLQYMNKDVSESDGDKMLYLVLQDGLKSFEISDNVKNSFEFEKDLIPNYYIRGVYFDGENIYKAGLKQVLYDYTEKQINIDINTDKIEYKPGDTVKLDISTKDLKGKPVKADVNISAVDEAFFAVREQYVDTLRSIYNYCYGTGMIMDYVSYTEINLYGRGMAEGGEGDNEALRTDFKDTAIFKTATTDNNGKASISFKLPDNLTSWRITYQGITKNLYAGNGRMNINAKLPFFVNVIMTDKYMKDDSPYMTLRSFGTELGEKDDVSYTVLLTDQKGNIQSFNKIAKGNEYANVGLKGLDEGKYAVTIEARSNGYYDGIRKEFEVVDSTLEVIKTNYQRLNKNIEFESGKGLTRLQFYNKSSALYYNSLTSLKNTWGERVDQQLSRIMATSMLNKNNNTEGYIQDDELSKYQLNDGGIALLPYSDSEPSLSAKVASLAVDLFDENGLKGYFYNIINNQNSTKDDVFYAYWGLAVLDEPVLIDIERLLEEPDLSVKDELILGVALFELGDTVKAEEMYNKLINNYGKSSGTSSYVSVDGDKDDILEATSLASVLSTKLKMNDRYALFKYVVQNQAKDILTNLEQLICVANDKPAKEQKVSFSYALNGIEKKVTLSNNETCELLLKPEEVNSIKFKDIEGEVEVANSFMSSVIDAISDKDDNISLSRSYSSLGKLTDSFEHSTLVKIVLTPEFSETAPDGYYEVTDILPSGLRYVKDFNYGDRRWYPNDRNGQKVTFGYYYKKGEPKDGIVYYARAVSPGEYTSDYAILKHYMSDTLGVADQQRIIIKE
ncbi:alpha-2-macroglobulin family protein [Brassicibacter mesophilus]|uniref:Ig-like domain-containing alpha-2-macroglobulin family protein n=1 Tax=Brassicibacter mesophilus TaxID=745119 RepID=UPI003D191E05